MGTSDKRAEVALKRNVEDLALFGGRSAFVEPLHVGRPNLGNPRQFYGRMQDVFERRWLSNDGVYVREFEDRISMVTEARHTVAIANATIALQVALRAAGVTGSVIVPSFTFVATVHALAWIGLRPIFCDVAPGTFHIDPARVESLIAPDTTAILGVHVWGEACDVAALSRIAQRRGLTLLFDAAHAFGCSYRGRMIGNFGSAEVFSFHATKFVNSFEGGAICTNDAELARRARALRDFGFDENNEIAGLGINGKMCEAAAAMGLTNLEHMEEFIETNRAHYQEYCRRLEGIAGIRVHAQNAEEDRNCQYVVLRVAAEPFGLCRDELMHLLAAENVLARRYFAPGVHRVEPYRSQWPALRLPETERLCDETLLLPTGTAVTTEDIKTVCDLIRWMAHRAGEIRERLRADAASTRGASFTRAVVG